MSRRDVIIIAVLVNAGLLAFLFTMAVNSDDDKIAEVTQIHPTIIEIQPTELTFETGPMSTSATTKQENHDISLPQVVIIDDENETDQEIPELSESQSIEPIVNAEELPAAPSKAAPKFVEVKVKSGDSLDKIARANGTTVKAIKDANNLTTDKLSIGKVLKVPVNTKPAQKSSKPTNTAVDPSSVASNEAQYYTLKSGDNPWKIAKQFNLKLDELLKLNNLDEAKARNLKPGDKVRVNP